MTLNYFRTLLAGSLSYAAFDSAGTGTFVGLRYAVVFLLAFSVLGFGTLCATAQQNQTGLTLEVTPSKIGEDGGNATVTVSGTSTSRTIIALRLPGTGTATLGTDYDIGARSLILAASAQPDAGAQISDFTTVTASVSTTVTAIDDRVAEGNETIVIRAVVVHEGGEEDVVGEATLTIMDNDERGVVVTPPALGLQEGGTRTYTVVLTSEPEEPVTVTVQSSDPGAATVSPPTLTFVGGSDGNWNIPQTVTVTAKQDDDARDEVVTLTHGVTGYGNVTTADSVEVTVDDDETRGVEVTASSPIALQEGRSDTYEVVLTSEPEGTVAVTVQSSDPGAATVSPPTLTFVGGSGGNWNTQQTVTVTAEQDDDARDEVVTLTHGVTGYGNVTTADSVEVTVDDDETRGVEVTASSPIALQEGRSDTYEVVLTSEPEGTVAVTVQSSDPGAATVSPPTLTFVGGSGGNWNTQQTVTVTAEQDDDARDEVVTLTHGVTGYGNVTTADSVEVTVDDDETRGVEVTASSPIALQEGRSDTYEVVLTSEPEGTVAVTVQSSDPGAATVSPPTLTFVGGSGGNWNTQQTVTVTAEQDDDARDEVVTLTHGVTGYGNVTTADSVEVTVDDDETRGVEVTASSPIALQEGRSDTYEVVLTSEPEGTVTVTVQSSDPGAATVSPPTLTFVGGSGGNWNTQQTVTVTAEQDDDARDEVVTLTHGVTGYGNVTTTDDVMVTVSDDDIASVEVTETTLTLPEGGNGRYELSLTSEPEGDVTVTVVSDDPGAVTALPERLTFDSGNWDDPQSVTVRAEDDAIPDDGKTVVLRHEVAGYGTVTVAHVTVSVMSDIRAC